MSCLGRSLAFPRLAINLLLRSGNIHLPGAPADPAAARLVAADTHGLAGPADNDSSGDSDGLCPICAALATIATGVVAGPPALAIDFASAEVHRPIEGVPPGLQASP